MIATHLFQTCLAPAFTYHTLHLNRPAKGRFSRPHHSTKMPQIPVRVGQFNILCPTYGVKWGEREACLEWKTKDDHGGSNWEVRWPAILRILKSAPWDILTLEELEESIRPVACGLTVHSQCLRTHARMRARAHTHRSIYGCIQK